MSNVDGLLAAYELRAGQTWQTGLSGAERIWMAIYDPADERRLRLRLPQFETATRAAGHGWARLDLTDTFAGWMTALSAREDYFAEPELMHLELRRFVSAVAASLREALSRADANDVVAVSGVASLFGLASVSAVLEQVTGATRGRMLVFFPGKREGSTYRFLDAHDGFNYLAVPIEVAHGS